MRPLTGATTTPSTSTTGAEVWHFYDNTATEFIVSSSHLGRRHGLLNRQIRLSRSQRHHRRCNLEQIHRRRTLRFTLSYADGKVYMVTSQRHIFVLDVNNKGDIIATATTLSSSWSSPTIANNRLYIGCNDWNVYCFKENTRTTNTATQATTTPTLRLRNLHLVGLHCHHNRSRSAVVLIASCYERTKK